MSFEQLGPACVLCMLKLKNNCSYHPSHDLGGGRGGGGHPYSSPKGVGSGIKSGSDFEKALKTAI